MKAITIQDIFAKAKKLNREEKMLIKKAYEFAKKSHVGQKRKTGEPYIIHPLYTAFYIADLGLGPEAICAALLHDTLEDCDVTEEQLTKEFNPVITKLIKGVSNLRHAGDKKITKSSLENIRRFLIVAADDIRVLIIKLADRLHNAQTIEGLKPERRITYAQEIQFIYSTLADYLGIYFFKRQFDDIAFRILNEEQYEKINKYLEKHHKQRSHYVDHVVERIKKLLTGNKIRAQVFGREKSIYSFYRKMQKYLREGKIHSPSDFGRIYDYYAFRIIVNSKDDCYRALGIIHSSWHPLPGEFDDYIANPKPNGFQSLQTTVFCDDKKLAEIQIVTRTMHENNEFGPASHIAYKLFGKRYAFPTLGFGWLRKITLFKKNENPDEELDFKIKVFQNNIFVLTPQNEVKQLPRGGTPIDFAYTVHTEIGNKCRGARVNGKMVSLDHKLHTGDQVEIIIDKKVQYPNHQWLEFVVSPSARNRIKHVLREKEKKEATEKGFKKLNTTLKKYHTTIKELYSTRKDEIDVLIYKNNAQDLNGLLASIGFNLVSTEKVIAALFPTEMKTRVHQKIEAKVAIEGSTRTLYSKAKCCNPKKNDQIIALTTITRGIRIHKKDCPYISHAQEKRLLQAEWI